MKTTLTKDEVAKILQVSERTIDNLRKNHGLPCISIGRLVRFTEDGINAWLQDQNTSDSDGIALQKLGNTQVSRN